MAGSSVSKLKASTKYPYNKTMNSNPNNNKKKINFNLKKKRQKKALKIRELNVKYVKNNNLTCSKTL